MNNTFEYIKDKDGKLYFVQNEQTNGNKIQVTLSNNNIDISKFTGFNTEFIFRNLYKCDDEYQIGYATVVFDITNSEFGESDKITIHNQVFNDVDYSRDFDIELSKNVNDIISEINNKEDDYGYVKCYYAESDSKKLLAFKSIAGGAAMNTQFFVTLSEATYSKFTKVYGNVISSESEDVKIEFIGGCDNYVQRSKIDFSDYENFNGDRYILNNSDIDSKNYTYSKPISLVPYINTLQDEYISYNNHTEMLEYVELVTENELYINLHNQCCVYDRFKPVKGLLSIFPIKDFYFNTVQSVYGINHGFDDEVQFISDANPQLFNNKAEFETINKDISFFELYFNHQKFSDLSENVFNDNVFQFGSQQNPIVYSEENIFEDKPELSKIEFEPEGVENHLNTLNEVTIPLATIQLDSAGDSFKLDLPDNDKELTDYIPSYNLFDHNSNPISTEYDYYSENLNSDLCFVNKLNPNINSWSMNYTDSFDQLYRLNTSKIFRYNNLSPNVSLDDVDILNNTHDAFYIMSRFEDIINKNSSRYDNTNEIYRYVNPLRISSLTSPDDYVYFTEDDWLNKLNDNDTFEELFNSVTDSKRINKQYSIVKNNETILHGVKYKISDYVIDNNSGKYVEVNNNKYDDYKFTYIMIPLFFKKNMLANNKPTIIINDDNKFIILVSFFNTLYGLDCGLNPEDSDSDSDSKSIVEDIFNSKDFDSQFIRTFIYAGCYNLLKTPTITKLGDQTVFKNTFTPDEMQDLFKLEQISDTSESDSDSDINYVYKLTGVSDYINDIMFGNHTQYNLESIEINGNSLVDNIEDLIVNDEYILGGMLNIDSEVIFTFNITLPAGVLNEPFSKYYNQLIKYNIYTIANLLENGNYNLIDGKDSSDSDSTIIRQLRVIKPDDFSVYDIFNPSIITNSTNDILGTSLTLCKEPRIQVLSRHSGFYYPLAKDILFFNNTDNYKYMNVSINDSFKDSFGSSFTINNVSVHKYSEKNLLNTKTPIYPFTGEYALTLKDINIFDSTFDPNYYLEQTSLTSNKPVIGTKCMVENNSMFGSKVLKLPNEIVITKFNRAIDWDQDLIGQFDINTHLMYHEENNTILNLYCFNQNILVNYLLNETSLLSEFEKFINPEYSFNRTDEIKDDCIEYIKRNVLRRYKLDSLEFYHIVESASQNNSLIENDYSFNNSDIISDSNPDNRIKQYSLKEVYSNRLDRQIIYNMISGNKESFNLKITFRQI